MKLKKFKERDNKKVGVIVFTLVCLFLISGAILYRTFAIFEVRTNQNVIKGSVQDPGNIYFAFYVSDGSEDKIQKEMPTKNYVLDEAKSFCGVNGEKDDKIKVTLTDEYGVYVTGITSSRTKCNLYFVKGAFILGKPIKATTTGDGLYETTHEDISGTLNDDGFKETEFRYAGASPNNYVTFNEEKWRIIGLVNVMTEENKVEQRVKIIRDESIGKYSWDLKEGLTNSNKWQDASLNKLLNESYYNSQSNITYYNCTRYDFALNKCSQNEGKTIDFSQIGIKENFKNMIEKVYWDISIGSFNTNNFQNLVIEERKGNSVENNIGMIYPSDYYYTTSVKNSCLLNLNWKEKTDCYNNAWLTEIVVEDNSLWTISGYENNNYTVMRLIHGEKSSSNYHIISYNASTFVNQVKPVLYLKSNVKIMNDEQDGSVDKPYHLQQIL